MKVNISSCGICPKSTRRWLVSTIRGMPNIIDPVAVCSDSQDTVMVSADMGVSHRMTSEDVIR